MTKVDNKIKRMKNNPQGGWTIEDLIAVADRFGVRYRSRGDHFVFTAPDGSVLTVAAGKLAKHAVYVKSFVKFIEGIKE